MSVNRLNIRIFRSTLVLFVLFSISKINGQCNFTLFGQADPLNCITQTSSATVTPIGGTPPYTYTWQPTGGNASTATGLTAGTYTIFATDANNCQTTGQVIIFSGTNLNVSPIVTNVTCNGYNNGQIITSVSGGSAPYTYNYIPAAPNTSIITNLSPGNYTVMVTDANGCTKTSVAPVTQPLGITANTATTPITCSGGSSGVTITVTGGTGPFTYSWNPISNTSSVVSNINPGNYTVTITDVNGCKLVKPISIVDPSAMSAVISSTNITCNGFANGKASVNVSGGTPAYTYTWMPGNVNSPVAGNLAPGVYTLTVKDSQGCLKFQTVNITQPAAFAYTTVSNPEFCINADGSAGITVTGGTGPYTYSWTSSPPQTNSLAINLPTGTYSVFVNDANGCLLQTAVFVGNISNINLIISSKQNVNCFATCNGSATATAGGGTGPYSFVWPSLGSSTLQSVSNLCSGVYTVKVTDANGCYTQTTVTISEPGPITSTLTGNGLICIGKTSTLTAGLSGGTPGYNIIWLPGNLTGTSVVVSPTVSTTYSLIITDANGCSGNRLLNLNVNPPLSFSVANGSQSVCPNVNSTVTIIPSGGDGNYNYLWAPGNYTASVINVNLPSTTVYTVTLKDGCGSTPLTGTVGVGVFKAQSPTFDITIDKGCIPLCVQFTNTTPSVTAVYWNVGDANGQYITPAVTHCYEKAGLYDINIVTTDVHGCKASVVKNDLITVYGKPKADFIYSPERIDLNNNDVTFKNTSINASQLYWTLDGNFLSTNGIVQKSFYEPGCITVKLFATNDKLCSDSTTKEICIREGFNFWAPNGFTPDDDTKNDIFIPKGTDWDPDNYSFEIFNRWGAKVFSTKNVASGWDGKFHGSEATPDVYVWKVTVRDPYGIDHDFIGSVTLIR